MRRKKTKKGCWGRLRGSSVMPRRPRPGQKQAQGVGRATTFLYAQIYWVLYENGAERPVHTYSVHTYRSFPLEQYGRCPERKTPAPTNHSPTPTQPDVMFSRMSLWWVICFNDRRPEFDEVLSAIFLTFVY